MGGGRGDGDEEMNTGEQSLCLLGRGLSSLAFSAVISDSPPRTSFQKTLFTATIESKTGAAPRSIVAPLPSQEN